MYLLNFGITQHVYLLTLCTFNDRNLATLMLLIAFKFFNIHALLDSGDFNKVHTTFRTKRMCTTNVNDIYVFPQTVRTISIF
jgi:hypothetical protein